MSDSAGEGASPSQKGETAPPFRSDPLEKVTEGNCPRAHGGSRPVKEIPRSSRSSRQEDLAGWKSVPEQATHPSIHPEIFPIQ